MIGGSAQGDWSLTVRDVSATESAGTLESWYLEINTGVQMLAGESVPVVVTLLGLDTPFGASRLFAGETLTADWIYTDGTGVTLPPVMFQVASTTSSVEVASTLSATPDATTGVGVLEATFDAAAVLVNAEIDPAVVPVQPIRRFRLAFAPATTARVLAGSTTEVMVVLENVDLLREGEVVRVSLSTEIVVAIPSERTLTADEESTIFTIVAPFDAVPPLGMVVALGEVLSGDVDVPVANTRVVSTTLAVEIAPRRFRLVVVKGGGVIDFEYVVAGGSTEVVVGISGVDTPLGPSRLDASERLQVGFVYTDGEGVTLSPVSLNEDVPFALATVDADEGATSGVLQLTGSGLVNADVAPVALRIEVLPNEFRLVFEPPQIGILTGTTETVVLSLTDASRLPAGDEVLVELLLVDASTVSVVSPTALSFNASATSHVVVLRAAADTSPGATVLVASVLSSPTALSGARFVDGELPVSIVGEREFEWVFRSPQGERLSTAMVVASASTRVDGASSLRVTGASTRVLVSLEGVVGERLLGDEQVDVSVSVGAQSGLEVDPAEFTFSAGEMSLELELELTAFLPLAVQRDDLQLQLLGTMSDTPERTTIPPSATLPVQVLREFTVSLALPNGTPLEITTPPDNADLRVTTVQILIGGSRRVMWVLDNPEFLDTELLGGDEKFLFDLLPRLPNGRVQSGQNSEPGDVFGLIMDNGSHLPLETVSLGSITGRVVSESDNKDVLHTRVVPITLLVEIVPRRFRLSLSPAGVVQFSRTERPNEAIPDNTATQSVHSTITVEDEITIESLEVRVEISHLDIGDLNVLLVSPEGAVVPLHNPAGGSAENLFETYTSLDHAGLATLVGAPAQGEWTLTVGDYALGETGTLEAWSLEINGFVRVLTDDSVSLVASLSKVETPPLSIPKVFEGEELEVVLAYDGTGVALSTQRVIFDADLTPVGVTLDALFDATRGTLTAVAGAISVNAEIAPVALRIEVFPNEFRLVFEPPRVGILTDTTETVILSLTDASRLPAGDGVLVGLRLGDASTVSVVSPTELSFNASTTSHEVVLSAAADTSPGATVLVASIETSPASLAGAEFVGAGLPVSIFGERKFEWVFRSPQGERLSTAVVVASASTRVDGASSPRVTGASTRVLVSLEGVAGERLRDGEQVNVSVSAGAQLGLGIEPATFTFSAGKMSQELELELAAFLPLAVQMDDLQLQGTVPDTLERTTIPPSATLPVQVLREFTFSFTTLDGAPLEIITQPDNAGRRATTMQVLVGGTNAVVLELDHPGLLGVGEEFFLDPVPQPLDGRIESSQNPEPGDEIRLTIDPRSDVPLQTVTLDLTGRVELALDGEKVLHTRVVPVSLRVEIVPRRFRLSLSSAAGKFSRTERPNEEILDHTDTQSVRSVITVEDEITIESLAVRVEILHPHIGDLRVFLVSPGGADVLLHGQTGSTADNLFETYTSLDHAGLAALAGERAQGEWTLTVGDYAVGDIGTLEAWSLEINGFAPLLAGGSVSLVASLSAIETPPLGVPRLFEGETLAVTLVYNDGTGVALSGQMVTFDAERTAVGVTLDAAPDATRGTLTAVVAGAVPVNIEVAPGALPVEIVPRRFRLSLSGDDRFSRTVRPNELIPDDTDTQSVRSVITVEDEITIESLTVQVEIRHSFIGDLRVFLVSPEGAMVALHDQAGDSAENLFETYTSLDHAGLAALVGAPAQGEWTLTVGDYVGGEIGTLEAWSLQINTGVQVLADESIPVVVTLSGLDTPFGASRLFAGETLTADWTYTDGVGVTLSPVVFDVASTTSSVEVASLLSATLDATAGVGVLEARFDAAAVRVNAEIDPAVVPVQPIRRFRLTFVPATTARVLAGGTTEVMVVLENAGLLREGETLQVTLQPTTVTVVPSALTLTADEESTIFTIVAPFDAVPPLGMVVASGEVLSGDAPVAHTRVVSTTLAMEIAPRRFRLVLVKGFEYVVAGGSAGVIVGISDVDTPLGDSVLDASETLRVDFVYTGGEGVTLSPVSLMDRSPSVPATVDAGEGATSGVLQLTGSGLVNADVAPVALRIEVLPNEFRLVFEPPQIGILTGTTETVVLSLTDASRLPAGDEVLVGLLLVDASTVSVVSPTALSFDASTTSHVVVLRAAADTSPGATTLFATVLSSPPALSDAEFVGAELPVSIVGEREFEWVFRSLQGERLSTAVVVASASTRVDGASMPRVDGALTRLLVSLEGVVGERLFDDEQVKVNVSVSAGAQSGLEIDSAELTFRAGEMSLELELELAAFLPLAVQRDDLQLQLLETVPGRLVRTTIPPSATLPVQVLREFTFSFTTLDGAPIEIATQPDNADRRATTVQILIGGLRRVVLVLDNPELLGVGEEFFLGDVPTLPNGRTSSGEDSEPGDAITLSIDAESDVRPKTVTLGLTGKVKLGRGGEEVLHTRVVPVSLRVEFVPRRFRLSLSPAAGKFSRTERPNEAIPGTFRQSVESDITVRDEITIESLAVRVEIRHPRIGDLNVLLISSGGAVVVVLSEVVSGPAEENLFETYTSLDHAGLAALAGESAQGQWTLSVGDYFSGETGTLEAWSLEINGFARVLAGGSAVVTASLVAIETPLLGVPELFAGETLEVALAYDDGTGVALSEQMVTFDAESTTVGVTLEALFYATRGTLTAVAAGVISVNAEIAPAALPVEIAPRRFRLSLSGGGRFSRTERPNEAIPDSTGTVTQLVGNLITVRDEITIESLTVRVEIRHPRIMDLRVFLVSPEETVVALHDEAGGSAENLFETYTSLDHAGLAALVGTPAQGEWVLTVGDYVSGEIGTLESWYLEINTGVQVLAGESIPAVVTLSGVDTPSGASRLFAGETLTVDWTYTDGVGVTLSPVVFDVTSTTSSIEAASILTATPAATAGVLEATFDAAAGLVNAEIDPAVVPVQPIRRFRLAFVPATTARVLAGGTNEVMVVLENVDLLREGETLQVTLQPTTVTVIPSERMLTADEESTIFAIVAPFDAVPPLGMVVASGEVLSGDAPVAYTQVVSTTLAVEIAPRHFRLTVLKGGRFIDFEYVVAGGNTEVQVGFLDTDSPLGLGRLDASETLQVDFVYTGGEGVTLSPVSLTDRDFVAPATVGAGEGATSGVLQLTGSGLVNANVAPVALRIEVLPNEFRLVFEPPQIGILTGTEETVVLSLTDASRLPAGDEVLVELLLDDASTVSVVSPTTLSFNASATSHEVVLRAAADTSPGATTLFAAVLSSPTALSGARFVDAGLPVSIVGEREFEWVFRSPQGERLSTAVVVAGASTRLLVSLEGVAGERLLEDEQVDASLSFVQSGLDIDVGPARVSVERDRPPEITLTAADTAQAGDLQLQLLETMPDTLERATISPSAMLPVRVLRELALSFTTPEGAPLETTARVLAGGTTEVVVALENAGFLKEGETLRVTLQPTTVTVIPSALTLTLTPTTPRATFTIEARHDAVPPLGMVVASGEVLSGDDMYRSRTRGWFRPLCRWRSRRGASGCRSPIGSVGRSARTRRFRIIRIIRICSWCAASSLWRTKSRSNR